MTLAARLLRQSDAPLSSLARQTGYTSEYAFANAFKREYGIAPGRYRAMPQPALAVPPRPAMPATPGTS
jgi:AraC-like DNA-binding protein